MELLACLPPAQTEGIAVDTEMVERGDRLLELLQRTMAV